MKIQFILLLSSLIAGFTATGAHAEKADRDKPMNIEADALKHDDQQQLTIFTGNVHMVKGTLVLKAQRVEVKQDGQGNQVAKLWANPGERIYFKQKREGLDEFTEGEAETGVYNSQADTLLLSSRAELRLLRGSMVADRIQGQQILVNNTTEVFTVDGKSNAVTGASGSQRVKATLTPKPKPTDTPSTPPSAVLKSSPRVSQEKP
jgi:lipopolysaccharide export system protein LptA